MDGTLLDIDINELIAVYFAALAPVIAPILKTDERTAIKLVGGGVEAMMTPHEGPNKEVFDAYLKDMTGVDLGDPQYECTIDTFYQEVFPTLQGNARPVDGASDAIAACRNRGLPIGIATQPIFPARAIMARLDWAGLSDCDLPIVSTYENSFATKPHLSYFEQMAQRIGVDPSRCIMVGDDPQLDMSAALLGMKTFYVGTDPDVACTWRGTLRDLIDLINES
jgi:FMN phosphatase YigB (HAD superfamily)